MSKSPLREPVVSAVAPLEVVPAASPGAVCVLGMHRSGTSLLTGLLEMCGIRLGPAEKIMQPKADNPSGFWEHLDIHEINEQLLARLGGRWDDPVLPVDWEASPDLETFLRRARRTVERDFEGQGMWAFKDPRTALLLPFWRQVIPDCQFIICVRHPLDVAKSLHQRDGLSVSHALRLWGLYTSAAVFYTRGQERLLLQPESLFHDWRGVLHTLQDFLGLSWKQVEKVAVELEAFIDREQWHHRSKALSLFRSPQADSTSKLLYAALLEALSERRITRGSARGARGSSGLAGLGGFDHLDRVSELVWQHLTAQGERERLALQLDESRERAVETAGELQRRQEELDSTRARWSEEVARKQDEMQRLRVTMEAELSELRAQGQAELAALRGEKDREVARGQESLNEARDRLFEQVTLAANLENEIRQRKRDIQQDRLEIARLKSHLAESQTRLEAVTSSLGWQLLDRYRDMRQRWFAAGRLPEKLYRKLVGGWRRRLAAGTSPLAVTVAHPAAATSDSLLESTELASFEPLPELAPIRVDPPRAWLDDERRPPVVVIIPNWNRVGYLRHCIASLLEETRYPYYRICVFDQGSTDGSREYLESLGEKVVPIFSPRNVGFVHANNVALRAFAQWDVVFLNNDTRVTRGWLENLVATAQSSEKVGLVGAKLVYPDGRLQEAGSEIFRDGSARAFGKFESQADPRFNQRRVVDYCSASCLLVKRRVLDQCGGFEECYSPCYYEDADLAFKARAAGYKTLYEPSAAVIHREYGTAGKASAFDCMTRNQERFVERWSTLLAHHPVSLWQAPAGRRRQVLVLGDIVPAPDRSAGGSRLYHLLRILAKEYDVTYAFLQDQMIQEYIRPLERIGVHSFFPGYARSVGNDALDLKAILASNSFHFVICSLYTVGAQYLGLIRERSPQSTILIDTYDVHFLREERRAEVLQEERLRRLAAETRSVELQTYSRADTVITVTDEDKAALQRHNPELDVLVIPTLHELPDDLVGREGRRDLLFVGGFSHEPNNDAVLYFCRDVLPLIRRTLPEIKLHIVGNSPTPEILALDGDGVSVWGYVPNLRTYLDSCLVSIAPIRYGSGMKGKVAEAMAHGLPVVTTSIGGEGMDLEPGVDVLVGDTPREFARRVVELCQDEALWQRIATAGHERVQRDWTPQAVEPRLLEFFRRAEAARVSRA